MYLCSNPGQFREWIPDLKLKIVIKEDCQTSVNFFEEYQKETLREILRIPEDFGKQILGKS